MSSLSSIWKLAPQFLQTTTFILIHVFNFSIKLENIRKLLNILKFLIKLIELYYLYIFIIIYFLFYLTFAKL